MVNKCCVNQCRGNYTKDVKVHVFSFPRVAYLRQKWIEVIARENFIPTKYTKVCHKHFEEDDILWSVSAFDPQTGKTITVSLPKPRLREGAVPSLLLGVSKHHTDISSNKKSANKNKQKRTLKKVLVKSLKESPVLEEGLLYENVITPTFTQGLDEAIVKLEQDMELPTHFVARPTDHHLSADNITDKGAYIMQENQINISNLAQYKQPKQHKRKKKVTAATKNQIILNPKDSNCRDYADFSKNITIKKEQPDINDNTDVSGQLRDWSEDSAILPGDVSDNAFFLNNQEEIKTYTTGLYGHSNGDNLSSSKVDLHTQLLSEMQNVPFEAIMNMKLSKKLEYLSKRTGSWKDNTNSYDTDVDHKISHSQKTVGKLVDNKKNSLKSHKKRCTKMYLKTNLFQSNNSLKSKTKACVLGQGGERLFLCFICGRKCSTNSILKRHQKAHLKLFQCVLCNKKYSCKSDLKGHLFTHTDENPLCCPICKRHFLNSSKLKTHLMFHRGEVHFECYVCNKSFSNSNSLKQHLDRHMGPKLAASYDQHKSVRKLFECKVCGKTFAYSSQLQIHIKIHSGERQFKCEICGRAFFYLTSLKLHQVKHTDTKKFLCHFCGKDFYRLSDLKVHEMSHDKVRSFTCLVLNKESECSLYIQNVQGFKTSAEFKSLNGDSYEKKDQFDPSNNSHRDFTNVCCFSCSKEFPSNSKLKRHMRVHSGEKPFPCLTCGKSFSESSALRVHLRIHSGEKPFKCEVCSKQFALNSHLKRHMFVHTKEKRFECLVCHKKFPNITTVKRHYLVHNGQNHV